MTALKWGNKKEMCHALYPVNHDYSLYSCGFPDLMPRGKNVQTTYHTLVHLIFLGFLKAFFIFVASTREQ